ncbi:DNA utilization protein GntX [Raoultella planticola]|uniref:DNA utilization protein GntX n=1 Tax=Raoultella planticola TaxID=575 RepID=A0A485CMC7_RAOPL|nr:DNA utilization protein GntX [Raoultella planticola]
MLTAHSLCWLCQMPVAIDNWGICSCCATSLALTHSLCPRCGLPAAVSRVPCGRCLRNPPPWQRLVTVNDYRPPLSGLIHQLKFSRRPELASALARLLLLRVRQREGFLDQTGSSASRYGSDVNGDEASIKATCYADRWLTGLQCAWHHDAVRRQRPHCDPAPPLCTLA